MKKTVTVLMLFCLLISCERKEPNFSEEMIETLADRGEISDGLRLPPPPASFLHLYVLISNKEFHACNSDELFYLYKEYYAKKFKSFEDFLDAVLNEDFVLDKKLFKTFRNYDSFKLNPKIEKEYAGLGFDNFLKKYSEDNVGKEKLRLNRSIIQKNEFPTIKYLLYKNKYDVGFDDYHATYYIWKRVDFFKQ
ncbi:hypothetical protein [Flavobacterium sp. 245]|uniref:hypothetical protein n=1 Tax=Flavobacterium sp. 245 TaxID=2512115 RepID=UPI00105D2F66|nr:hypothetical protein [Flavobacterium sp. 245]TDP04062.1 hypothetical protein EV145_101461 [Flavobacterium sp. 245]